MRHSILFIMLVLSISCVAQTMLDDGNVWTYCTVGYNGWHPERPLCELTFSRFFIQGSHEAAGRLYKDVYVEYIYYEAIRQDDDESGMLQFVLSDEPKHIEPEFCIGVREESGRVYTNAGEFDQLYGDEELGDFALNSWHPFEDGEYVLYDYNDYSVPCISPYLKGCGISTEVIPYVGNTSFLFVIPDIATDGIIRDTRLNLFFRQGVLEYQSPIFHSDPFYPDITTAFRDTPAPQIVNGKSLNGKWFDLSGRCVSHLQKGVYIKDGRKVVVR